MGRARRSHRIGPLSGVVALALLGLAAGAGAPVARAVQGDEAEPAAQSPATAELRVTVDGLSSEAGTVAFALYATAASYEALEEPVRKGRLPVDDGACTWVAEELPPGDYALSAYHDVNGNGELDKGAFGVPTEPYGFSNDAPARLGPPPWEKVRFEVTPPRTDLRVRLR